MQQFAEYDQYCASRQLRPVVITVIAAKLAVFALLMTTLNLDPPIAPAIEVADLR